MKVIIDTSSLLSLVRYYLPFDKDTKLYDFIKKEFLESADARMIILALNEKNEKENVLIITEESEIANDHKAFKKIPAICKILDIKVMTLPELLETYNGIDFEFK